MRLARQAVWLFAIGTHLSRTSYAHATAPFEADHDTSQIPLLLKDANDSGNGVFHGPQPKPKNIVFILSDDQDSVSGSVATMPRLKRHVIDQGTYFANHFTTTAICCPSRVSLWTGRQPHTTNVTDVDPPYGGFPKFISQGLNDAYLPVWLQNAGYSTYYTGKMFNSHTVNNYNKPHLKGWTSSNFLLDPGTYSYLNPIYQKDHDAPVQHSNRHTTDLIQGHASELLAQALKSEKPFFVAIAPVAPHSNIDSNDGGPPRMMAPIPLPRHSDLFAEEAVPRTANFNPAIASGASWIRGLPRLNSSSLAYLDHFFRERLRALQGVDELVEQVVTQLEGAGVLDDTYMIYSSDNGFHVGQHRLPPGKECGFEEDIRVPLYVRGPGVAHGRTQHAVTTHVDLVPTIFRLAGIDFRDEFDGVPIPLHSAEPIDDGVAREHVAVEYWGTAIAEGEVGGFDGFGQIFMPNNTYKAIRVKSDHYDLYYSVWCSNERELYDLTEDPEQNNLYPSLDMATARHSLESPFLGSKLGLIIARLDSLMMVMKSCKGKSCVRPWGVLHPEGDVETLQDALDPRFDDFYRSQTIVSFDRCEPGYIISAEGPQVGFEYRRGLGWSHWA